MELYELSGFLMGGFIFASVLFAAGVVLLAWKSRRWSAILCFVIQWVFTTFAFQNFWKIVRRAGSHVMLTELNSGDLGLAGLCWGVSILVMLAGVYFLTKQPEQRDEVQHE